MKGTKTVLWIPGWAADRTVWDQAVWSLGLNSKFSQGLELATAYRNLHPSFFMCEKKEDYLIQIEEILVREKEPVTVVGWSLGSLLALHGAIRFPEQVEQLLLVSVIPCFVRKENFADGHPETVVRKMKRDLQKNPEATLHSFYDSMLSLKEKEQGFARKLQECTEGFSSLPLPMLQAGLDLLLDSDLRRELSAIRCPVHLFHGADDVISPSAFAHELVKCLPVSASSLTLLENTGHIPFVTRESDFQQWIKERFT